ncbi:MAG: tetratricopeptide repeat protein [Candidatus Omnitrophica bacterium]|nr:tetratricopeptide repeat protein [Candidatus Omnitrophota bacterium]
MTGDNEKSERFFRKVTALTNEDTFTFNNQGAAYYGLGDFEKSIEAYNRSLSIKPNAIAYYDKGAVYSLEKRKEESLNNLKLAIELDTNQKNKAKIDSDYNFVRNLDEFKELVH